MVHCQMWIVDDRGAYTGLKMVDTRAFHVQAI